MQITFDPFSLTADQAILLGDFLARAAGVLPVSDRPDVGTTDPQVSMPAFAAPPVVVNVPAIPQVVAPAPVVASVPAIPTFLSPAPAASAPAPAVEPPAAPAAPEKDARGLPWDERIHSANKTTNADGTWRRRSKIDDQLVKTVEAELLGLPAPTAPPVPTAAALAAAMSSEVPAVPPAAPTTGATFAALASRLNGALEAGKLGAINTALAPLGVAFIQLAGKPELVGTAQALLQEAGLLPQ